MIVTKFGGSSLCSATQIKKACAVQLADTRRQIMVVSAPGKRFEDDVKVTDLLINLSQNSYGGQPYENYAADLAAVTSRFRELTSGLLLDTSVLQSIENDLKSRLDKGTGKSILPMYQYLDLIKAAGEDNCAFLTAEYLKSIGIKARYLSPSDTGMVLSDEPGNARILPLSYTQLNALKDLQGIGVYPGFFGHTESGNVVTFGRGGSDITGSILAVAVQAELYENFTDVDNVFAASPSIVQNPAAVPEITYREMRELAYAGFTVLHEESIEPVLRAGIPLNVKNLNNPASNGTLIVKNRDASNFPIAGIAGTAGFCVLTVGKFLMNREIGFGRRLFQLLEDEQLSFDHAPSGIDTISPIFKQAQFNKEREQRLIGRIQTELNADFVDIARDIAIIMLVGQGLFSLKDAASRAVGAVASADIDIKVLIMCANTESLAIGVEAKNLKPATAALYKEFFAKQP